MLWSLLLDTALLAAVPSPPGPGGATLLFVAEADKVAVVLAADFECRAAEPQRLACNYAARIWSTAPALAPTPTGALVGREWSAQFNAPRPIDGWPERDELSLIWHGDGGYEVRTGGTGGAFRLATRPAPPRPLAGTASGACTIAVVGAELRLGKERWRGLAVVERYTAGAGRCLEQPGSALLATGRDSFTLLRPADRAQWKLLPDGSATPISEPFQVLLVDGISSGDRLVPTAVRLYTAQLELLLEQRAPAAPSTSGALELLRYAPLAGAGYQGGREVRAAAVMMPL